MCGGRKIWEISVPSSQPCCEPKTALKKSVFFFFKWYLLTPMTGKRGADLTSSTAGPRGLKDAARMLSISCLCYSVGFVLSYCKQSS